MLWFRLMAIFPAGSSWVRNVLGVPWMARKPSVTSFKIWIFVLTKKEGQSARIAAAVKFALTTANGNYARSAAVAAFAFTIAKGRFVRSAVAVKFAFTIATGNAVQCARLNLGSRI